MAVAERRATNTSADRELARVRELVGGANVSELTRRVEELERRIEELSAATEERLDDLDLTIEKIQRDTAASMVRRAMRRVAKRSPKV